MAAISMPKISSVYRHIVADFPKITFLIGKTFKWSAQDQTITHPVIKTQQDIAHLLHEIGHARLNHNSYVHDIQLVHMEREAWGYATRTLAPRYGIALTHGDEVIQSSLDTYRQWLHDRSACPACQAVGIEQNAGHYLCLNCRQNWRVNEARACNLRRHKQ